MSLGKDLKVHEVVFYIHGGEGAVSMVLTICRQLELAPYDTEAGGILTAESRPPVPPPLEVDEQPLSGKRGWWGLGVL